jgi:hypothetical protein
LLTNPSPGCAKLVPRENKIVGLKHGHGRTGTFSALGDVAITNSTTTTAPMQQLTALKAVDIEKHSIDWTGRRCASAVLP